MDFNHQFDLVVSFSAMQWVKDQHAALSTIYDALKPGGQFLMMIPAGYPFPLDQALEQLMHDTQWQDYFTNFDGGQFFYNKEQYEQFFANAGFSDITVELIPAFNKFDSIQSFTNFMRQWLPHLIPIPKEQHDEFMTQLMKIYLSKLPAEENGTVWFKKYSLEALVKVP